MKIEDLAQMVLDVLDMQQAYFKSRERDLLIACKEAEARLRLTCSDAIRNSEREPS